MPYPYAFSGICRHFDRARARRFLSVDAKALGIAIPQSVLVRADKVIE